MDQNSANNQTTLSKSAKKRQKKNAAKKAQQIEATNQTLAAQSDLTENPCNGSSKTPFNSGVKHESENNYEKTLNDPQNLPCSEQNTLEKQPGKQISMTSSFSSSSPYSAAAVTKQNVTQQQSPPQTSEPLKSAAELKSERKAEFERKRQLELEAARKTASDSASSSTINAVTAANDVTVAVDAKSKAELKAERRALQEAQRAEKQKNLANTAAPPENPPNQIASPNSAAQTQPQQDQSTGKTAAELKAERKAEFERKQKLELEAAQLAQTAASSTSTSSAPTKSKAELKAERRALQEAQRAAKSGGGNAAPPPPAAASSSSSTATPSNQTPSNRRIRTTSFGVEAAEQHHAATITGSDVTSAAGSAKRVGLTCATSAGGAHSHTRKLRGKDPHPAFPELFSHLAQPDRRTPISSATSSSSSAGAFLGNFPVAQLNAEFVRVGCKMDEMEICGATSRCLALIAALRSLIEQFFPASGGDNNNNNNNSSINSNAGETEYDCAALAQDFSDRLDINIDFLNQCRAFSPGMHTLLVTLRKVLNASLSAADSASSSFVSPSVPSPPSSSASPLSPSSSPSHRESLSAFKARLSDSLAEFEENRIHRAHLAIQQHAATYIHANDVIVTFGFSRLVGDTLLAFSQQQKQPIRVICVDAAPFHEGRQMCAFLQQNFAGGEGGEICCEQIDIGEASQLMRHSDLVLIGAYALLHNGAVVNRIGSGTLASIARKFAKPFVVLAESYKITGDAKLHGVQFNEVTDPDRFIASAAAASTTDLSNWRDSKWGNIRPLCLLYDVIPARHVTAYVSDEGVLPVTSIPTLQRLKQPLELQNS